MSRFPEPNVPFVESAARGTKLRPKAIVLKSSQTSSAGGIALALANTWHQGININRSTHYVVDEEEVFQTIPLTRSSPDTFLNTISITLCGDQIEENVFWDDPSRSKVLSKAAALVGQLCLRYRIPVEYCRSTTLLVQPKWQWFSKFGICIPINNGFPTDYFLQDVRYAQQLLRSWHGLSTKCSCE